MEYRPVFVQFIKKQKCRYNPSFQRFFDLPRRLSTAVLGRWSDKHPGAKLPDLEVNLPPAPKSRKRS